jgi:hypothetical protein
MIFLLGFTTVSTVLYFLFFILFILLFKSWMSKYYELFDHWPLMNNCNRGSRFIEPLTKSLSAFEAILTNHLVEKRQTKGGIRTNGVYSGEGTWPFNIKFVHWLFQKSELFLFVRFVLYLYYWGLSLWLACFSRVMFVWYFICLLL